jgi:hypothetical protein
MTTADGKFVITDPHRHLRSVRAKFADLAECDQVAPMDAGKAVAGPLSSSTDIGTRTR